MLSTNRTLQRAVLILAALATAALAVNSATRLHADDSPPTNSSPSLHDLEQEHVATLREMATLATRFYKSGAGTLEEVNLANRELVDAELKYAALPEDRVRILTDAVAAAKEQEKTTNEMAKLGTASAIERLDVKAYRLSLEVSLARETVK